MDKLPPSSAPNRTKSLVGTSFVSFVICDMQAWKDISTSAQRVRIDRSYKFTQRDADFMRRIFLEEMAALNRDLALVWQRAAKLSGAAGDNGSGIAKN
jgi:hypothetical protein